MRNNLLILLCMILYISGCHKKNKPKDILGKPDEELHQYITTEENPASPEIKKKPENEPNINDKEDEKKEIPPSEGPNESEIPMEFLNQNPTFPPPLEDTFDENEDDFEKKTVIIWPACRGRNGIVTPPEQCDDNNDKNNDGCNNMCGTPVCGNGIVDYGEECDDCFLDKECTFIDDKCANCLLIFCGNKRVDPGEQCDDGNQKAGDGCSPTCQFEHCCPTE